MSCEEEAEVGIAAAGAFEQLAQTPVTVKL